MNALYDFHTHGIDLLSYDHITFSGVVPRSFVGLLYSYLISYPQRVLAPEGFSQLLVARCAVAAVSFFILRRVAQALERRHSGAAFVFACLIATQFHLPFYASRTLGNTFGLWATAMGLAGWIDGAQDNGFRRAILYWTLASVVFRFETVIVLGAACAFLWWTQKVSINSLLQWVMLGGTGSVLLTCAVDSFFWSPSAYSSLFGIHWPELSVFLFNVPQNESSKWGVQPFHWYFTSALPKALGPQLVILPFVRQWSILPFAALLILSALPHKEVRFLFPAILAFTAYSAMVVVKSRRCFWLILLLCIPLCALGHACAFFNYPGGHALMFPHRIYPFGLDLSQVPLIEGRFEAAQPVDEFDAPVHLDTYTTTVGVSRFIHPAVVTKEGPPPPAAEWVLAETKDIPGFELRSAQLGFSRLQIWPPRIILEPKVFIHRRKRAEVRGVDEDS